MNATFTELDQLFEGVDRVDLYVHQPDDPEGSYHIFLQELLGALEAWVRSYTPEHGVEQVVRCPLTLELHFAVIFLCTEYFHSPQLSQVRSTVEIIGAAGIAGLRARDLRRNTKDLIKKFKRAKELAAKLKERLKVLTAKVKELEALNQYLEGVRAKDAEKFKKEKDDLSTQIAGFSAIIKKGIDQRKDLRDQLTNLQEKIKILEADFQRVEMAKAEEGVQYTVALENVRALEKKYEDAEAEILKLRAEVSSLAAVVADSKAKIGALTTTFDEKNDLISELEAAIDCNEQQLADQVQLTRQETEEQTITELERCFRIAFPDLSWEAILSVREAGGARETRDSDSEWMIEGQTSTEQLQVSTLETSASLDPSLTGPPP